MYICLSNKAKQKLNIMKTQLIQDLESAKGQLNYTNEALASNLESWERKEFQEVKAMLIEDIASLENRIEFLS